MDVINGGHRMAVVEAAVVEGFNVGKLQLCGYILKHDTPNWIIEILQVLLFVCLVC